MAGFSHFEDRLAVLTGGASGIGLGLLLGLVQRGTDVAVCDLDGGKLDVAIRQARAVNPDVRMTAHVHDVADEAAVSHHLRAEVG